MNAASALLLLGPALAAGLLIVATHVPLGLEVLKRRIVFMDLAVAQCAALGLLVYTLASSAAHAHELHSHVGFGLGAQLSALAGALGAALSFHWAEKRCAEHLEAVIGSSYVVAASCMALLVAHNPFGAEAAQTLIHGQILFVSFGELLEHAPVYLAVLLLWWRVPKLRQGFGFYALFALAITSSVQLVGVYVVFASLILPALAAQGASKPLLVSYGCGWVSFVTGLVVSVLSDWPSGAVLVLALALGAVLSQLIRVQIQKRNLTP